MVCLSIDVQRWDTRLSKQRFRCNVCGIYLTSENIGVKKSNELVWFKKRIVKRQNIPILSRDGDILVLLSDFVYISS
jgi:hypothetical protein